MQNIIEGNMKYQFKLNKKTYQNRLEFFKNRDLTKFNSNKEYFHSLIF